MNRPSFVTVICGLLPYIPKASGLVPAPYAPIVTGPAFPGQLKVLETVHEDPLLNRTLLPAVAY